jgi:hypothetical protein
LEASSSVMPGSFLSSSFLALLISTNLIVATTLLGTTFPFIALFEVAAALLAADFGAVTFLSSASETWAASNKLKAISEILILDEFMKFLVMR